MWQFLHCLHAIDDKHVLIKHPPNCQSMFYNYYNYFSLVLQNVSERKCKFIGSYEKQSDGGTFWNMKLYDFIVTGTPKIPKPEPLPNTLTFILNVFTDNEANPLMTNLLKSFS